MSEGIVFKKCSIWDDQAKFMLAGNQGVCEFLPSQVMLYQDLIVEEAGEFGDVLKQINQCSTSSEENELVPDAIKEAIDLIVVVAGWLISNGIDPQAAWDIVHANNMAKVAEKVEKDENGKIKKSPESIKRKEQMMADLRALIDA